MQIATVGGRWWVIGALMIVGCTTRPAFFPNSDPAMHKTSAQFASDAAHHHYETDAPRGGDADGAVEIDYGIHRLNLVNSSGQDWNNIEVWVNKKYEISVPKVLANHAQAELIPFNDVYDEHGNDIPYDNQQTPINSVEMFKDGKMYNIQMKLAD